MSEDVGFEGLELVGRKGGFVERNGPASFVLTVYRHSRSCRMTLHATLSRLEVWCGTRSVSSSGDNVL
jgi:hypothetical protein